MIIDMGEVKPVQETTKWHEWFAWRPVLAWSPDMKRRKLVWRITVDRVWAFSKYEADCDGWMYRVKP